MSVNYADALSPYPNKGVCGINEITEEELQTDEKILKLADAIRSSRLVVVHSGAGISTSAGIPDFRGPRGVWTLEKQGKRLDPSETRNFDDVRPTFAHRAIVALMQKGYVHFVVTQNIDGLHLRSGIPRCRLVALHGDVFTARCAQCGVEYTLQRAVPSFGMRYVRRSDLLRTDSRLQDGLLSSTRDACPKTSFRSLQTEMRFGGGPDRVRCIRERCRGSLRDSVLDWQDELPNADLANAQAISKAADLNLVLGSSLQIEPTCNLPFLNRPESGRSTSSHQDPSKQDASCAAAESESDLRANGSSDENQPDVKCQEDQTKQVEGARVRTCIVNLQPTRFDDRFDIRIFERIDTVMRRVCEALNVTVAEDCEAMVGQYPAFIFDLPAAVNPVKCDDNEVEKVKVQSESAGFDYSMLNIPHVVVSNYAQSIPISCLPETLRKDVLPAAEEEKKDEQSTESVQKARYSHRVLHGSLLEFVPEYGRAAATEASTTSVQRKQKHSSQNESRSGSGTKRSLAETQTNLHLNGNEDASENAQTGDGVVKAQQAKRSRKRGKRRR